MTNSRSHPKFNPTTLEMLRAQSAPLRGLIRGIEKESLRVSVDGRLSNQPHPYGLGSPLTHPSITTDFSEAQLELITGIHDTAQACLQELNDVHRFVYQGIEDELLWPSSMPCMVGKDADIPVGKYGSSNIGQAKTVYRRGLGLRYGRLMQTISGIHYNFSLPDDAWTALGVTSQDQRTDAYFALIRNFRRWSWLLIYLFGASPTVCRSFTTSMRHSLQPLDEGSLYLPHATSLRMGPLGYQSSAQADLHISYNSLDEYAESMVRALTQEFPSYAEFGLTNGHQYHQLSTTVLQIENEFYGTIRPKRRTYSGERPITALRDRGVEYVEVRCLDLNPFLPVGIDVEQCHFIDTFLMMCLLANSDDDSMGESNRLVGNQVRVVEQGRRSDLTLQDSANSQRNMIEWSVELLEHCMEMAKILDGDNATTTYQNAVASQQTKVDDPSLTPSAQILSEMKAQNIPFFRFAMNCGIEHRESFAEQELSQQLQSVFNQQVIDSHHQQQTIEAADKQSFSEFLTDYLALPNT